MIPEFGVLSLILALLNALVLVVVVSLGCWKPRYQVGFKAVFALTLTQCVWLTLSFFTLVLCFIQNDFTVAYVAHNSNRFLALVYRICAVWGAHEGSLLLWAWILGLWILAVNLVKSQLPIQYYATVMAILSGILASFLYILLVTSNPFLRLLPFSPENGADLNPLLQDPGFIIHPPFLYIGYVGFAIPFAFALASLWLNKTTQWTTWVRPYALLAWSFLTVGIALGSWWAYYELGWGGWWFWDPVENASFMPWLVGTALCHSLFVHIKQQRFLGWCTFLGLFAFILSLLGTFLVRSGVISSVHSFASDPTRGLYLFGFLAIVMGLALGSYGYRFTNTRSKAFKLSSKESFLWLANLTLIVACISILIGTLYPLAFEVFNLGKISVGAPFFNQVFIPMAFLMVFLAFFAPRLAWRQDFLTLFWGRNKRHFIYTMIFFAFILLSYYQSLPILSLVGLLLGSSLILITFMKGVTVVKQSITSHGFKGIGSQCGMILAHIGLGVSVCGMSLTAALETESEVKMAIGQSVSIAGYQLSFDAINTSEGSNFTRMVADFSVTDKQKKVRLQPQKRYFPARDQLMTETAIHPGFFKDFYLALGEPFVQGEWTIRFYVKPFIRWIWLGALLIASGALFASIYSFRQVRKL